MSSKELSRINKESFNTNKDLDQWKNRWLSEATLPTGEGMNESLLYLPTFNQTNKDREYKFGYGYGIYLLYCKESNKLIFFSCYNLNLINKQQKEKEVVVHQFTKKGMEGVVLSHSALVYLLSF